MKAIESHKDLIVWRKSISLASQVYAATRELPSEERYGLSTQLRRSAVSIASNIAEGAARKNRNEFLQSLHIARGSLAELETQMMIATDQRLIAADELLEAAAEVGRLLNGLIRRLQESRQDAHAKACMAPRDSTRSAASPDR